MTTRKDFIAASAIIAAALPEAALADAPPCAPTPVPKLKFDLAAFNGLLDRKAAHKHLFSARKIESGSVFDGIRSTLDAYRDIGVPLSGLFSVAVFYHGVSPIMAFDDSVWATYVPAAVTGATGKSWVDDLKSAADSGKGNPFAQTISSLATEASIHLFVCNNAVRGLSGLLAKWTNQPEADVYNDLVAHLLPSASLVPAGVWAIHAIQQRGYTLLPVS